MSSAASPVRHHHALCPACPDLSWWLGLCWAPFLVDARTHRLVQGNVLGKTQWAEWVFAFRCVWIPGEAAAGPRPGSREGGTLAFQRLLNHPRRSHLLPHTWAATGSVARDELRVIKAGEGLRKSSPLTRL